MKLKILKVTDNPLVVVRVFLGDGTELSNIVGVVHSPDPAPRQSNSSGPMSRR